MAARNAISKAPLASVGIAAYFGAVVREDAIACVAKKAFRVNSLL
jgi:hypothetical protein